MIQAIIPATAGSRPMAHGPFRSYIHLSSFSSTKAYRENTHLIPISSGQRVYKAVDMLER